MGLFGFGKKKKEQKPAPTSKPDISLDIPPPEGKPEEKPAGIPAPRHVDDLEIPAPKTPPEKVDDLELPTLEFPTMPTPNQLLRKNYPR